MLHGSILRNLIALVLVLTPCAATHAALVQFIVPLSGSQEVPGPGDADGSGLANLIIDDVANSISWTFTVNDIVLPLNGAHIHQGAAGASGLAVVNFNSQLSGSGLVDADLANVLANPTGFYVNLHNASFPSGAIRGQLAAPVPLPAAAWLFGTGLLGLLGMASRKRRINLV